MNTRQWIFIGAVLSGVAIAPLSRAASPDAMSRLLPAPLEPWRDWATWDAQDPKIPRAWNDVKTSFAFWPSVLQFDATATGATAHLEVTVFREGWLPLPGNGDHWPVAALADGEVQPIIERVGGRPAIRLGTGVHRVDIRYLWKELPQRLAMPPDIGIVALTLEKQTIEIPAWDSEGFLWLRRNEGASETARDFLSKTLYAVLQDGIPLQWQEEIELVVSGKNREEDLGYVLPEGWSPASVTAPIPVALDAAGRLKAQVRPGKWTIRVTAFRLSQPDAIRFEPGKSPATEDMLVGFQANTGFRIAELTDLTPMDVTQTTFPADWRGLPVYRWKTAVPFQLKERLRGMGIRTPDGLKIVRDLWLDEDGVGFTYKDVILGTIQEVWRLDAVPDQDPGSIRSGQEGLLITRNPKSSALGVELRMRNVALEAVGRMEQNRALPASGWQIPIEAIQTTLHLPPGYRLFALFGPDRVQGDWLTAWTLLDLFFLLVFSIAVTRLWGFKTGIVAFLAFVLSYHEPGAPRVAWLLLLIPLAILRAVVSPSRAHQVLTLLKWGLAVILVLQLTPFVSRQAQQALYPQLDLSERHSSRSRTQEVEVNYLEGVHDSSWSGSLSAPSRIAPQKADYRMDNNLRQDAKARIQTGPGIPEWQGRIAQFGWSGPVDPAQRIRMILIPRTAERLAGCLRIFLAILLFFLLLKGRSRSGSSVPPTPGVGRAVAILTLLFGSLCFGATNASAQLPDARMLDVLRERLTEAPDAFPNAADLASVQMTLDGNRIAYTAEIHVAARCAVPLPGRLPAWSPLRVQMIGENTPVTLRREKEYLWIVLLEGIHRVRVEGLLPDVSEWEMTYLLKPRHMTVQTADWTVSGIGPNDVPEAQTLFVRLDRERQAESSYEHRDFHPMVLVQRNLELGLVWQVHTTVRRLSPPGRTLSLRIPLLPGEQVLTGGTTSDEGFRDVRLGASETTATWNSELPQSKTLRLETRTNDTWVEQWTLSVSPVWNVATVGLAPATDATRADLNSVWTPWPGESAQLVVTSPEAVAGKTLTVHRVSQQTQLGPRMQSSTLDLAIQSSLGEDMAITLPAHADITTLTSDDQSVPVRKEGDQVILPVRPAMQRIHLGYRTTEPLGLLTRMPQVRLPDESANVQLSLTLPDNRWLLWARGPMQGPAIRFWGLLIVSLLAALALAQLKYSPLGTGSWILLALGLTQVPLPAALIVIGWLFLLQWRGRARFAPERTLMFNLLQSGIILTTLIAIGILVVAVSEGLLGHPDMFVRGNGSTRTLLQWYQAHSGPDLPRPDMLSISIWWYRFLMLLWALWLATALIRWLRDGWTAFNHGGRFRKRIPRTPPPVPAFSTARHAEKNPPPPPEPRRG